MIKPHQPQSSDLFRIVHILEIKKAKQKKMIKGQKLIQTSTTSFISKLQKENTKERRNKT